MTYSGKEYGWSWERWQQKMFWNFELSLCNNGSITQAV